MILTVKTKSLNSNFGICTQCIKYDSYVPPGLLGSIPVRKKSESALLVFMLLGFLIKIMAYFSISKGTKCFELQVWDLHTVH